MAAAQSPSPVLLTVAGLNHSFVDPQGRKQTVLQDFSLEVSAGESVALWGASGSGKTTLLNLIAGLLRPDSGSIVLHARNIQGATGGDHAGGDIDTGLSDIDIALLDEAGLRRFRRQSVGYVFQFFNLIETLSVAENIALALELAGQLGSVREAQTGLARQLEQLGLDGLLDRFPAELSGGEQQRVAVLRALIHRPALVLADEPTGNLDASNSERVAQLLWQQVNQQNAALLIATHSREIAERADRIVEIGAQ